MNAIELAYIAGFFDGEGTCGIKQIKGKSSTLHSAYVTISQVRPEVLHWIRGKFGGSIMWKKPRNNQGIWALQLSCAKAISFLETISPYLRIKKSEADLVVAAFQVRTKNRRRGVPTEIVDFREGMRKRIMDMR